MKIGFFLFAALFSVISLAADLYPKTGAVNLIIEKLDITSFPSSIGPRREPGKTFFKDYGFDSTRTTDRTADLETMEKDWIFHFDVVDISDSGIVICLTDKAQNGGSYSANDVLLLTRENPDSLLKGNPDKSKLSLCGFKERTVKTKRP